MWDRKYRCMSIKHGSNRWLKPQEPLWHIEHISCSQMTISQNFSKIGHVKQVLKLRIEVDGSLHSIVDKGQRYTTIKEITEWS